MVTKVKNIVHLLKGKTILIVMPNSTAILTRISRVEVKLAADLVNELTMLKSAENTAGERN
jgi:hypothetical protein